MSDALKAILLYTIIFGGILVWSLIDESKRKKWRKENPEFAADYDAIDKQMLNYRSGNVEQQYLQTNADKNYNAKIREAERKDWEDDERDALACINCGAPLKAIYMRCEYCGLSHVEARKNQGMSREEVELS